MKYFTIEELCKSNTASKAGINNDPDEVITANLISLVDNILDPLRIAYGSPIYVESGYRCPKLNSLVGGAKNSQHTKGQAADIKIKSKGLTDKKANRKLYELILKLKLPFDQLILEKGTLYEPNWIHISYKSNGPNRGQKLYYNGKSYMIIK